MASFSSSKAGRKNINRGQKSHRCLGSETRKSPLKTENRRKGKGKKNRRLNAKRNEETVFNHPVNACRETAEVEAKRRKPQRRTQNQRRRERWKGGGRNLLKKKPFRKRDFRLMSTNKDSWEAKGGHLFKRKRRGGAVFQGEKEKRTGGG